MEAIKYIPGVKLCGGKYEIVKMSWWNDGNILYEVVDNYSEDAKEMTLRPDELHSLIEKYGADLINHYVTFNENRTGIVVLVDDDIYRVMYYSRRLNDFLICNCKREDLIDCGLNRGSFTETLDRLKKENES